MPSGAPPAPPPSTARAPQHRSTAGGQHDPRDDRCTTGGGLTRAASQDAAGQPTEGKAWDCSTACGAESHRRDAGGGTPGAGRRGAGLRKRSPEAASPRATEAALRDALREDPNDETAFPALAELVRRRAAEGHEAEQTGDPQRAADNAVWALAEELAQSPRAWRPLLELARLSVGDDHDAALRRLGIAAERDPSGRALAEGLSILREAGLPDEALGLGVGHWRPREHDVEAGRHLVAAAVDSGRFGEARRHLKALSDHPDQGRVKPLQQELERYIAQADRAKRGG
ncbi:hypothetical protein [Kineococcus glutinatus]|uniref:Tetratricopeptide repeat protein n=1 Tax=Kineococcus glutinatus TaxID=1070872 RepID=A0ABP9H7E8_9ACTN